MHIVNTDAFRACAEAIANLRPDYTEGRVTSCQVKVLIGEMLDVWPASIFEGEVAGDETPATFLQNSLASPLEFVHLNSGSPEQRPYGSPKMHNTTFDDCFHDRRQRAAEMGLVNIETCFDNLLSTSPAVKDAAWDALEAAYKVAGARPSFQIETRLLDRVGRDYFPKDACTFIEELIFKLNDSRHSNAGGSNRFISEDEDRNPSGVAR